MFRATTSRVICDLDGLLLGLGQGLLDLRPGLLRRDIAHASHNLRCVIGRLPSRLTALRNPSIRATKSLRASATCASSAPVWPPISRLMPCES